VTPKPQTTRSRLLGILTLERAQLLLLDTPGLQEGRAGELHASMQRAAGAAAEDCDLALLLVDSTKGFEPSHRAACARLCGLGKPWLIVGTKVDLRRPERAPWPPGEVQEVPALLVSAPQGAGVSALLDAIVARLPPRPPLRAPQELTDTPLRFLAGELVREAVFQQLREELPSPSPSRWMSTTRQVAQISCAYAPTCW